MKNNNNSSFTAKQKQAAIVCVLCALALIITICMTAVQVMKASAAVDEDDSSSSSSSSSSTGYTGENYIIDASVNDAILTETEDMGDEYLDETLFIGDSNTVRFYNNGLLTTQQFCALEGLTIQSALTEKFVTFKNDDELYTIAEAVAMMKPRRVVITLGTNNADGSMSTTAFISAYEDLIDAILESYEYTDIIINSIPPVIESQTSYPDIEQETIDEMNMALAEFAQESGYKFLNTAEALKDNTGYGDEDYYVANDIHLKAAGLNAILNYVTTHAYISEDRRPDTDDIATRTNSSSSASGTTGSSSSSTSSYTAKYFVDTTGGGTLTSGGETGNANLSFDVTSSSDSVTVTAVPDDGYAFVKWSDGVTTATRTDTSFTQNVNVTAVFGSIGITIQLNTSDVQAGTTVEFEAVISGGYASLNDVVWYVNDVVNASAAGGKSWMTVASNTDYIVYATVTYNGTTVTSSGISIEQEKLYAVPDITGMTEANAKAALVAAGFVAGTVTYQEVTEGDIGVVTFQATTAVTEVVEGSAIIFTVTIEATTYAIPDVIGMSETEAKAALTAAGFTGSVTITTAYDTDDTKGKVISQSPTSDNKATAETSFVLIVSLGAQPVTSASLPTVATMTQDAAISALDTAGFAKYTISEVETSETNLIGTVKETSPAAGTITEFTTSITIYVYVASST